MPAQGGVEGHCRAPREGPGPCVRVWSGGGCTRTRRSCWPPRGSGEAADSTAGLCRRTCETELPLLLANRVVDGRAGDLGEQLTRRRVLGAVVPVPELPLGVRPVVGHGTGGPR